MNEPIVPLKCLYNGLPHPVALRAVYRRTADSHVDTAGKGDGGPGKIIQTVIRQLLNRLRKFVDRTKAILHGMQHQIADGLRTDPAGGRDIAPRFPITTIQTEDYPNHLLVPSVVL